MKSDVWVWNVTPFNWNWRVEKRKNYEILFQSALRPSIRPPTLPCPALHTNPFSHSVSIIYFPSDLDYLHDNSSFLSLFCARKDLDKDREEEDDDDEDLSPQPTSASQSKLNGWLQRTTKYCNTTMMTRPFRGWGRICDISSHWPK